MTTSNLTSSAENEEMDTFREITFIHLDLGIGGAEQLVLQLAQASQDLGYNVNIVTTRCDQDHCFASVKAPEGNLCQSVCIYGNWIPANLGGTATAFCSTLRMLYLTWKVITKHHSNSDIIVVDVLPTSLPLVLRYLPTAGILFYCHFPDKLLLRSSGSWLKRTYRKVLDGLEEYTMGLADTLVVNSRFTLEQTTTHFPSLRKKPMSVLYPALDTTNMVQANNRPKTKTSPIVSLNRFERKKNIGLLIQAYAYIRDTYCTTKDKQQSSLPPLIIAGGYDTQNIENVEYRGELQILVNQLGLQGNVVFRMDISDAERTTLFQTALCVAYTPDKEHFGIVPLEAMYAGTPVIAVNSGGPLETVKDGLTGYLRDPTPEAFGDAIWSLLQNPKELATNMGRTGRTHVEETFGTKRFETEWNRLLMETWDQKEKRRKQGQLTNGSSLVLWTNTIMYMVEACLALLLCILLTSIMRWLGVLGPTQSIFGVVRQSFANEEL